MIASLAAVPPRFERDLVSRDRHEQPQHLSRVVEIILARGGADKKAGQDRLADVHRVKKAAESRVADPHPHFEPDHWLIPAHQLGRGLGITGPDAPDEVGEGSRLRHRPLAWSNSRPRHHPTMEADIRDALFR